MFKEFKEFALKGNLIDMAVAFVMGAAFTKLSTAFIEDLIMPVIGQDFRWDGLLQQVHRAFG